MDQTLFMPLGLLHHPTRRCLTRAAPCLRANTSPAQVITAFAPVVAPYGLAFDSAGYLYPAQEGGQIGIVKIATTGTETLLSTGIPEPVGLAFSSIATATPEPGGIGLIAVCGLAGALAVRRKQRTRRPK